MIAPANDTPLELRVAEQVAVRYRLVRRAERAWTVMRKKDVGKLLASHHDRWIKPSEIKQRDNLDELLAGLTILHLGGLDDRETLAFLGLDLDEIVELLEHPDVARYFEAIYPFAPPILLREAALQEAGDYPQRFAEERRSSGWTEAFNRFLLLDTAFNAPGPLEDFLGVLDSYRVGGFDLSDLQRAFRNEKQMKRFLKQEMGRDLAEGLGEFLDFSGELDIFLDECRAFPIFRGLTWLTYGYWYGAGGRTMREVILWVMRTLETMASEEAGEYLVDIEDPNRLGAMMDRLTNLGDYPAEILKLCERPLQRWSLHVIEQQGKELVRLGRGG